MFPWNKFPFPAPFSSRPSYCMFLKGNHAPVELTVTLAHQGAPRPFDSPLYPPQGNVCCLAVYRESLLPDETAGGLRITYMKPVSCLPTEASQSGMLASLKAEPRVAQGLRARAAFQSTHLVPALI